MGNAIDQFVLATERPCESLDLTVGRSSVLVACSLILEGMAGTPFAQSHATRKNAVSELGNRVLRSVWSEVAALPPVSQCDAIDYTGMAHGWAGLCYAALLWSEVTGRSVPDEVTERLEQLADLAEPVGRGIRWPIQATAARRRTTGHGYLTSWCHGTPGHVHLWRLAFRRHSEPRYRHLAESAAWNAWEDDDDNASLCCGLAGRAYALLAAYRETGDASWLDRARQLARRAQASRFYIPTPESLYKGELGVALLTADLESPLDARHPFFELVRL
jgi:serine/threonine-protein kinase